MKVVAVGNQKGGVGKTTVTMQLAASLSRAHRVLVVDVDPQGSTSWWAENAADKLPFDFSSDQDPSELSRIRELAATYDLVLVDAPGSLEDARILGAVLDIADFVIVPLPPEPLAVMPTMRTISSLIEPRGIEHRVLLNRIDPRVAGQLEQWCQFIDKTLQVPRFANHLRVSKAHADAPMTGQLVTTLPDTRRTAAAIFDTTAVALELRTLLTRTEANGVSPW